MRAAARLLGAALLLLASIVGVSQARADGDGSPDAALARLLAPARAGCATSGNDVLGRVLCAGRLRVGVRPNYPQFSNRDGGVWTGYEIDLANTIGRRLGVAVEFVSVSNADRISALADGRYDLAIARIGHNTQRDGQALFVRPHYYQSQTILVGDRGLPVSGWHDLAGRTVCVPVGNGSNTELSANHARLLLFDDPIKLLDALQSGACSLVAHDDSVFTELFMQPDFARRFDAKFGFAPVPWGMAVSPSGGARLAQALGLILQQLHRDGTLLALARGNSIPVAFLEAQQAIWQRPDCDVAAGNANQSCILPPLQTDLQPTGFAGQVHRVEQFLTAETGVEVMLPMLTSVTAWSLMKRGVVNTLVLIAGALAATFGFALGFGALLDARSRLLRWPARLLVVALQSSPVVLTLVIAIAVANALVPFSAASALAAAMLALGLANGANAGQAISESLATLRIEAQDSSSAPERLFRRALWRARSQIQAFLVNATKGTPVASFIGAPELLNALTDINAFSSTHLTTYVFMLAFYLVAVFTVVLLCGLFDKMLAPAAFGAMVRS
jgi:ABC-type amino acid transport substrate-binding protein/ABC-type amino acid transport system permease subunit